MASHDEQDEDHGFANAADYDAFKDEVADAERLLMGFATTADYDECIRQGFTTKAEYDECMVLGFVTKAKYDAFKASPEYEEMKHLGFETFDEYEEFKQLGCASKAEYDAFKASGELDEFQALGGFTTKMQYDMFKSSSDYEELVALGFTNKAEFDECKLLGFATKAEYDECKLLGCATRTDFLELKWRGAERRVEVLEAEVAELREQLQMSAPFAPVDAPEGPLPVKAPSPPAADSEGQAETMLGGLLPFSPRRLFQFASSKHRASWSLSAVPTGIDRATFIELVQQLIATENKEASLQGMEQQQEASAEYIGSLFDAADTEGMGTITEGGFLALYAEVKAEDADHIAL